MARQKTDERIREIKQQVWQKRKKRIRIFLYAAGIIIVLLATINARRLLTSLLWDVKALKVKNIRITPYNAVPLITGLLEIETGKNMLFLDIDGLRERITGIREVEDCTVRKIYPSTLEIGVTLRKPWIMLKSGAVTLFIDRTGKVLAPDETPDNLLQVDGIGVNGNSVDTEDIWKMAVLKQIEKCYNFNNLQKHFSLAGVRIAKPTEIILYETAGTRKILLINEDIPWKMEQLRATLEECEKDSTEWEYVDLRFENPYVKHTKSNTDAPRSRKQ